MHRRRVQRLPADLLHRLLHGRDLRPDDNLPGAPKVAILGHAIWQRDFGGSADILGKGVRINGTPATIELDLPKESVLSQVEIWPEKSP